MKTNPAYAALLRRFPALDAASAALPQLTDNAYATPAEAQALTGLHADTEACRRTRLADLQSLDPARAAMYRSATAPLDEIYVALVQRQMTWGEGLVRLRRLDNEVFRQTQILAAETEERRRAMLMQMPPPPSFSAAPMIDLQRQQQRQDLINSVNRPRTTNCNSFGFSTNCTSF